MCQRNWIPNHDKAVKVANYNLVYNQRVNKKAGVPKRFIKMGNFRKNTSQKPEFDNANSIPIGNGVYSMMDKYMGNGNFRRMRTDVTLIRNQTFATR